MAEIKDTAEELQDQTADSEVVIEEPAAKGTITRGKGSADGPSIRRSTFIEAGNEEVENVVYVHDKPFKKLAKQAAVTAAAAVLILATVGFIMGLTGLRTPHISGDAISNQWDSLFGDGEDNQKLNELEKNP
jgi:hypothetical protein